MRANTERLCLGHVKPGQPFSDLMPAKKAAAYLGASTRSLERWRAQGIGPLFLRRGKLIFYSKAQLNEWLTSLQVQEASRRLAANDRHMPPLTGTDD